MTEYELKKLAQNEQLIKLLQEKNSIEKEKIIVMNRIADALYYYDDFGGELSIAESLHDSANFIFDFKERLTGHDEDNGLVIECVRSTIWTE